ncbi:Zn-dependent exopeptidase [Cristinia sonorae]|uniref:Peptide hydrolase n=1 Tax=Cristinia sonorae TaxID=1940300 RepID=A0A8K0XMM8_9AGAR|nr:Zn-dependent exopeptidase [Cristinia sonorae]
MVPLNITALTYLLVSAPTSNLSTIQVGNSCLSTSHHYQAPGGTRIFFTDEGCLASLSKDLDACHQQVRGVPTEGNSRLLWVEREEVEAPMENSFASNHSFTFTTGPLDLFFKRLETLKLERTQVESYDAPDSQQHTFRTKISHADLLVQGPDSDMLHSTFGLISIHPSLIPIYDSLLPPYWRGSLLPEVDSQGPSTEWTNTLTMPVPPSSIDRVRDILHAVQFDKSIEALVNDIKVYQMKEDIRLLTGEDDALGITSRHSFSMGIRVAAKWIKEQVEATGATCQLSTFLPGFGPNIICTYPSIIDTPEIVLLSAHYDSRGSFLSLRAPGGDDDGSGTISLLAIARAIGRRGITFRKNVQLCWFAGEEQGLIGSTFYARELRSKNADLVLMVQADMLAYHLPGEPPQLGLPLTIGTREVADLVSSMASLYSPELTVGYTSTCCSDHQSFHGQGFPATQVFERAGPIVDPMYHNSGDVSDREGYDFEQVRSIAKVQFATLLQTAGFNFTSMG